MARLSSHWTASLLLGLTLVACGIDTSPAGSAADLGECQVDDRGDASESTLDWQLARVAEVVRVASRELRGAAVVARVGTLVSGQLRPARDVFDLSALVPRLERVAARASFDFDRLLVGRVHVADLVRLPADSQVLVGLLDTSAGAIALTFAVLEPDGDIFFVGDCAASRLQEPLSEYAQQVHGGRLDQELVIALLTDDAELDLLRAWLRK
jgi:hypothetical protein